MFFSALQTHFTAQETSHKNKDPSGILSSKKQAFNNHRHSSGKIYNQKVIKFYSKHSSECTLHDLHRELIHEAQF